MEAEGRCERMLKIWREEMVLQVWHAESQGLRAVSNVSGDRSGAHGCENPKNIRFF